MTEEEKAEKLINANKDLKKGKEILGNFNFSRYHQAKDFIDDCCKSIDYAPYIMINRTLSGMFGNIGFMELKYLGKIKVLKMIVTSIEEYIAELTLKDNE